MNSTDAKHCSKEGCKAWRVLGSDYCYFHDPLLAASRRAAGVKGGRTSYRTWREKRRASKQRLANRAENRAERAGNSILQRLSDAVEALRKGTPQPSPEPERSRTPLQLEGDEQQRKLAREALTETPTPKPDAAELKRRADEAQAAMLAESMHIALIRKFLTPEPAPAPLPRRWVPLSGLE